MLGDRVYMATGGQIKREDRCTKCGEPMLYRVDSEDAVIESFCANVRCAAFLLEIPDGGHELLDSGKIGEPPL